MLCTPLWDLGASYTVVVGTIEYSKTLNLPRDPREIGFICTFIADRQILILLGFIGPLNVDRIRCICSYSLNAKVLWKL